MTRDLPHLSLPAWDEPLRRRLSGGGKYVPRDHKQHGDRLVTEAEQLGRTFEVRQAEAPEGIQPRLIFKLQLHKNGQLDDDTVAQMGLRVTAREPNKAIVVFPDDDTLHEFRRRLAAYAEHQQYKALSAIEAISAIAPADRIGPRLAGNPLAVDGLGTLDLELWHTGFDGCRQQIDQIKGLVEARRGRATDEYVGHSLCLMRVHVDRATLDELAHLDFVREIDRRPEPSFDMLEILRLSVADVEPPAPADLSELPGVVVLDSGVATGHPLLAGCVGDAQDFTAEGSPADDTGHGTAVAGIAAFGDISECIERRRFEPTAAVFSGRVLDSRNLYDEDKLVETQLLQAIDYFTENYPNARVFNLSIGASAPGPADRHQYRLAAALDEIAYDYREREIVFVVPSGNFWPDHAAAEQIMADYPGYLMRLDDARLVDPATAAIPLTVGGLSFGGGKDFRRWAETGIERPIAGEELHPSPFTRIGPGVQGAVKPDLVDLAGDLSFERGRLPEYTAYVGVPTLHYAFSPPEGRLFTTVAGTSFAAPRVANAAARLMHEFPGISSNLVRALFAASAVVPPNRPRELTDLSLESVRRIYGYGITDFEHASRSATNDVLLLYEGTIPLDEFQLFLVPPIPPEYLETTGSRDLSVTLAFDPPTRHTRADSYLGATMQFALYRNVAADDVADGLRAWARSELHDDAEPPEIGTDSGAPFKIALEPGVNTLKKGCLQKASRAISRPSTWRYDGGELVLAVICRRKWAPREIEDQRYAVVVSLSHSDEDLALYARIREHVREYQRVRLGLE